MSIDDAITRDPLLASVAERDGFKVLPPCILLARLGEGGLGTVFRAYHWNLGIDVAVKLIGNSKRAEISPEDSKDLVREARALAQVRSENLVAVHDVPFDRVSRKRYIIMELVDGISLGDLLKHRARPLDERAAVTIIAAAARGLSALHRAGLLHLDVKLSNILIDRGGCVKLSDLGMASEFDGPGEVLARGGSPSYQPPEQAACDAVTPASDVFSMGVSLARLLCGEFPYPTAAAMIIPGVTRYSEKFSQCLKSSFHPLCEILEKSIAPDPSGRFRDAVELSHRLEIVLSQLGGPINLTDVAFEDVDRPTARKLSRPDAATIEKIRREMQGKSISVPLVPEVRMPTTAPKKKRSNAIVAAFLVLLLSSVVYWVVTRPRRVDPVDDSESSAKTFVRSATSKSFAADDSESRQENDTARESQPATFEATSRDSAVGHRPTWGTLTADGRIDDSTGLPTVVAVDLGDAKVRFRLIRPGSYRRGSDDPMAPKSVRPAHQVAITRPFYLAETELVGSAYREIVGRTPESGWNGDHRPVERVSFTFALEIIKMVNRRISKMADETRPVRLPTEAEWEYACRADSSTKFFWGDDWSFANPAANFNRVKPSSFDDRKIHVTPPGQFPANDWGIMDMHGNVAEWCADVFLENAYERLHDSCRDPLVEDGSVEHVVRGGSYASPADQGASGMRIGISRGWGEVGVGLRLAADP